jgi:hypothetical protein
VLQAAAGGDWNQFYCEYLLACTRETALACRQLGVPLRDVDDLIQDLAIRLQKNGAFAKEWRERLRGLNANSQFRGNIPAKYLHARQSNIMTARFRTYLKAVIKRLIFEHLRRRIPIPRYVDNIEAHVDGILEESIDRSIDRHLVISCLDTVAHSLAVESLEASTKARQRMFSAIYYSIVKRFTHEDLAVHFHIDRTTAAGLLKAARQRFVALLVDATGIDDREYLHRILAKDPAALVKSLKKVESSMRRRASKKHD